MREEEFRQRQFLGLEEAVAEAKPAEGGDTKTLAQIAALRLEGDAFP